MHPADGLSTATPPSAFRPAVPLQAVSRKVSASPPPPQRNARGGSRASPVRPSGGLIYLGTGASETSDLSDGPSSTEGYGAPSVIGVRMVNNAYVRESIYACPSAPLQSDCSGTASTSIAAAQLSFAARCGSIDASALAAIGVASPIPLPLHDAAMRSVGVSYYGPPPIPSSSAYGSHSNSNSHSQAAVPAAIATVATFTCSTRGSDEGDEGSSPIGIMTDSYAAYAYARPRAYAYQQPSASGGSSAPSPCLFSLFPERGLSAADHRHSLFEMASVLVASPLTSEPSVGGHQPPPPPPSLRMRHPSHTRLSAAVAEGGAAFLGSADSSIGGGKGAGSSRGQHDHCERGESDTLRTRRVGTAASPGDITPPTGVSLRPSDGADADAEPSDDQVLPMPELQAVGVCALGCTRSGRSDSPSIGDADGEGPREAVRAALAIAPNVDDAFGDSTAQEERHTCCFGGATPSMLSALPLVAISAGAPTRLGPSLAVSPPPAGGGGAYLLNTVVGASTSTRGAGDSTGGGTAPPTNTYGYLSADAPPSSHSHSNGHSSSSKQNTTISVCKSPSLSYRPPPVLRKRTTMFGGGGGGGPPSFVPLGSTLSSGIGPTIVSDGENAPMCVEGNVTAIVAPFSCIAAITIGHHEGGTVAVTRQSCGTPVDLSGTIATTDGGGGEGSTEGAGIPFGTFTRSESLLTCGAVYEGEEDEGHAEGEGKAVCGPCFLGSRSVDTSSSSTAEEAAAVNVCSNTSINASNQPLANDLLSPSSCLLAGRKGAIGGGHSCCEGVAVSTTDADDAEAHTPCLVPLRAPPAEAPPIITFPHSGDSNMCTHSRGLGLLRSLHSANTNAKSARMNALHGNVTLDDDDGEDAGGVPAGRVRSGSAPMSVEDTPPRKRVTSPLYNDDRSPSHHQQQHQHQQQHNRVANGICSVLAPRSPTLSAMYTPLWPESASAAFPANSASASGAAAFGLGAGLGWAGGLIGRRRSTALHLDTNTSSFAAVGGGGGGPLSSAPNSPQTPHGGSRRSGHPPSLLVAPNNGAARRCSSLRRASFFSPIHSAHPTTGASRRQSSWAGRGAAWGWGPTTASNTAAISFCFESTSFFGRGSHSRSQSYVGSYSATLDACGNCAACGQHSAVPTGADAVSVSPNSSEPSVGMDINQRACALCGVGALCDCGHAVRRGDAAVHVCACRMRVASRESGSSIGPAGRALLLRAPLEAPLTALASRASCCEGREGHWHGGVSYGGEDCAEPCECAPLRLDVYA